MTLNRADFPDLTDEQWDAIQAEGDRRATDASKTARKNAEKEAERVRQAAIDEALEEERTKLAASEEERLQMERKKIEDERAKVAAERREFAAKTKLLEAGLPADKVDTLLPLFTGVDDKALDTALDTFINTHKESVKAQVDAEKQALIDNAQPSNQPVDGPVDVSTAAQELLAKGEDAAALDIMLKDAGYAVPTE